jgi:hypothetical protein
MIPRRLPVRSFAVMPMLAWSLVGSNLEPHKKQGHHHRKPPDREVAQHHSDPSITLIGFAWLRETD